MEHDRLAEIAARIAHTVATIDALLGSLLAAASDPLEVEAITRAALERPDHLVLGAGVIRAGSRPSLSWWWRRSGEPEPLTVALEPNSLVFYDVEHRPWFLEPWRTGTLSVVGPYLDRSGTDTMVVTLTRPLPGEPPGIVGADLALDAIFDVLVAEPAARDLGAILENSEGRIIASANPRFTMGELDRGPWRAVVTCEQLPWRLVVREAVGEAETAE